MTAIKICGLSRECDIDYVNEGLPEYIGFVFAESRRRVDPDTALRLRKRLDSRIKTVGVFVNEKADNIIAMHGNGVFDIAQLHGSETPEETDFIRSAGITVIKAVRIDDEESSKKAKLYNADYFLFDCGSGGGGKTFDWSKLKYRPEKPFFLAGGLGEDNIRAAVDTVKPFAADVSSGAETDGFKDREKILKLIKSVRERS